MINTNCEFLQSEMMDVVRLFHAEEEEFTHYFSHFKNKFFNAIEYQGEFYDFEEEQEVADDTEYKRYAKRFAKLAFYKVLKKAKNMQMPWGALTGIRPTKLAYMEQKAGRDFKALFRSMDVSEANISLVEQVLKEQTGIYKEREGQDIFISIPFCPTKCEYCSFITAPITATRHFLDDYITCLCKEIENLYSYANNIKSIYIGGGTPFVLEPAQLERIYQSIQPLYHEGIEYTVEAGRPDVFTEEKLELSKRYHVNRICVNPQTFSNQTLVTIGRKHTAEQVFAAYEMAKKYGFDINVDLIAGLTGETLAEFTDSLKKAISLDPENITVHTLCLKAGARLKENCDRLSVQDIGQMIACSRNLLEQAGYVPYYMYRQKYQAGGWENTGWTKTGKACVYNIDVMEEITDNIAVGANAISKKFYAAENRLERLASPKDLKTYIQKVDQLIEERKALFQQEK